MRTSSGLYNTETAGDGYSGLQPSPFWKGMMWPKARFLGSQVLVGKGPNILPCGDTSFES